MATYFDELADELRAMSWPTLEIVARDDFHLDPDEFETKEELVQACVAQEQHAAFH